MMKLYVGNLPYSFDEDDLKNLFSNFASLASHKLIIDRDSGRSKGFGFVEFNESGDAESAIKEFNGHEIEGRALVVNEARPQEKRERRPR